MRLARSMFLTAILLLSATARAQTSYDQRCPLLDLGYPVPPNYGSDSTVKAAMTSLQGALSTLLSNTSSAFGSFDYTSTAFSIDLYSLRDESSLFTYSFTPDLLKSQHTVGVEVVDAESTFRIGSVSKLYTVYLYLIAAGDQTWNQPVTQFVPELAAYMDKNRGQIQDDSINFTDWDSVTVGALASQMAGVARDAAYSVHLEDALELFGLPPPSWNESTMCGDNREKLPCNRADFFQDYLLQHPIVPAFKTPIYSNAAYQILAYVVENITGSKLSDLFQKHFVEPLDLSNTFYTVPPSPNTSFIPINETISWWSMDALDETPAAGYYSSINDLRAIGRAILNSTLLSPAQTRRWMKPYTFTANSNYSVGAPWEIRRAPAHPVSWIYSKEGDIGLYAATTALLPDYEFGFTILAAGYDALDATEVLGDTIAAIAILALQVAKKTAAAYAFGGTYIDNTTNSSITVSTNIGDGTSGLAVTSWNYAGHDILALLGLTFGVDPQQQNLTVTLYDTGLTSNGGSVMSWRATYALLPQPRDPGAFSENCATWEDVNSLTYGGVGLDEFLFTLEQGSNRTSAVSVQNRVLSSVLQKTLEVNGVNVPGRMRRS